MHPDVSEVVVRDRVQAILVDAPCFRLGGDANPSLMRLQSCIVQPEALVLPAQENDELAIQCVGLPTPSEVAFLLDLHQPALFRGRTTGGRR